MDRRDFLRSGGAFAFLVTVGVGLAAKTYRAKFMWREEDDFENTQGGAAIDIDGWRCAVLFSFSAGTPRFILERKARQVLRDTAARHFQCDPKQIEIVNA